MLVMEKEEWNVRVRGWAYAKNQGRKRKFLLGKIFLSFKYIIIIIICLLYYANILFKGVARRVKMGTAIKMLQHLMLQHSVATLRKIILKSAIDRNPQLTAMSAILRL
jgi:hypothetical protein